MRTVIDDFKEYVYRDFVTIKFKINALANWSKELKTPHGSFLKRNKIPTLLQQHEALQQALDEYITYINKTKIYLEDIEIKLASLTNLPSQANILQPQNKGASNEQ